MGLISQLLTAKRIALDSMVFIYLLEQNEKFFSGVKTIFELLEAEKIEAVTSIISPLEVLSPPKLTTLPDQTIMYRRFFQEEKNLSVRELDWEVMDAAAQIRRESGLRTPDAIQLATAKLENTKLFITNDKIYNKVKTGEALPKIILLSEFS
jgi:predicted nucleic acid-binding protein